MDGFGAIGPEPKAVLIPLQDLRESPMRVRKRMSRENLEWLAASIKAYGILHPLMVRTESQGYEVICGTRRLLAARIAGVWQVPCFVREFARVEVIGLQLIESIHTAALHPLDVAEGVQTLMRVGGMDTTQVSEWLRKPYRWVTDHLQLLDLGDDAKEILRERPVGYTTMCTLARQPEDLQDRAVRRMRETGATVAKAIARERDEQPVRNELAEAIHRLRTILRKPLPPEALPIVKEALSKLIIVVDRPIPVAVAQGVKGARCIHGLSGGCSVCSSAEGTFLR